MMTNGPWDKTSSVLDEISCFPNNIIHWISRNYPVDSRKPCAFLVSWACDVGDKLKKNFLDNVYEYSTKRQEGKTFHAGIPLINWALY